MLRELFTLNRSYIEHFFDTVDISKAEEIFSTLRDCEGTLFFTGVGKSGLVAEKIAVTMISTGTRALYISATNALHGDLGMVSDKDVFLFFSKSGESEELVSLAPYIRNRGAKLVAIVSRPDNRLVRACPLHICLPLKKELCPFDLAPTTSTAIQMIFGDVLTIALMKHKQFSLDDYALNHPAGAIGKRISLRVNDLMIKDRQLPRCSGDEPLLHMLGELSSKGCGCLLVTNSEGLLEGIFTDGDLRRALQKHGAQVLERPIRELMTHQPRSIQQTHLAWDAMKEMESDQRRAITCLPVTDDQNRLLGLIKMHDILQSGL